jgi:photosystem II stability/assembly factor-like uncharacterized protein
MKKTLIIILSMFLFTPLLTGQTSWQWLNPLPQGNLLNGITEIGQDTLFAAGDYGTIIKSTNGGATWLVTPTAGGMVEAFFDVDFGDADHGWAVGVTGQAVRTTNGGETWQFEQLSTYRDLIAIQFRSSTYGWISGSKGTLLSTRNGGSTWYPETTNVTVNLYDVFFVDSLNGWSVGASGTIIHSTDGGNSWTPQSSGTTQPLYSISFVSPSVGYIAGAFGKVLKTVNGGASWTPLLTNAIYSLYRIRFTDPLNGWAMGSFGSIIKTTNGGLSWFEQSSNTYNDIYAVSFYSATIGYAAGDYGTLLKTTNGGATWNLLSTGTKNIIYGVHFPNSTNGFAVGEEGTFAKSTDGGYHWSELFTGIFQTYYGVWFVDNNTGWIVGDSAVILKTTNGGVTWNDQNSRSEETLNSVYFLNASHGWVVGDYGTILVTTNGGSSWNAQTVASFTSFLKIRFANDQVGWVVGYSGEIFKTTNGGTTWTEQFSGTTQAIYSLQVIDVNTVYAVGDFGTLLKTTDGGENWVLLPNDFYQSFYGLAFSSATTGWAVGDEGTVAFTSNGGSSWTTMRSGTAQNLFDVQLVHLSTGGILFAAGEGGTLICSAVTPLPVRTWTGGFDSLWTFTGNWDPIGIPGKADSVIIPATARNPVIRSTLQQINIGAMKIAPGAKLTIRDGIAEFVVKGNINVDGTLEMDAGAATNFVLGRDFVVSGSGQFLPGHSTVMFTGNGLVRGTFHSVTVGDSIRMQSVGNVVIKNSILAQSDLILRSVDTLTILNGDPAAFQGIGLTGPGTVKRAIEPATLESYRFESPVTTLRFNPIGTLPDTVSMTAFPGVVPPGQGDSVFVRRWYDIAATGGSNYMASLSLRYDTSETSISIDDLVLFRDSANVVVNMGQTDYLDSDLVAVSLDSVRHFSRWYLGYYDYLPKNQFQFTDSLMLTDNGGVKDTIFFGAFPGATNGIDTALGEAELLPPPAPGTYDVRWVIPPTQGSLTDIRDILTMTHIQNIYTVRLQPGPGGYPFALRWNNANFPAGKFTLRDKATGGSQFSVNMKTQNTYSVTNPSVTQVEIVHDGPDFFPFNSGWNIVSLPLKPTGTKAKNLIFPTAVSKAFYFDNGYQFADSMVNGVAYWLKFPNAQNIGIDGDTVLADTIPVAAGWNMIGTVTLPVGTAGILQQPSNIVISNYFGFGASYTPTTTLEPARGYWVKTGAAGNLILSSSGTAAPKTAALPQEWEALSTMNAVTLTDRHGFRQTLRFGVRYPDGADPRSYELPPPPPAGVFDARFATDRAADVFVTGSTTPIVLREARYPVTIEVSPGDAAAAPAGVDLTDAATGATIATNVGPGNPFTLRDPSITSIIIKAGNAVDIPVSYALHQNFPNPFNPSTAITFDLPSEASVSIRIFNVLGQTVARLAEHADYAAGRHRLDFRADAFGSGIYFCRMDAVGTDGSARVFSIKMLLLK